MDRIRSIIATIDSYRNKDVDEMLLNCVKAKLNSSLVVYYEDLTNKLDKAYSKINENIDLSSFTKINKNLGVKK